MSETMLLSKDDQPPNPHVEDEPDELLEIPMHVRIDLAYDDCIYYSKMVSVRKIARAYGVVLSTL
jgi:hypothetical protein